MSKRSGKGGRDKDGETEEILFGLLELDESDGEDDVIEFTPDAGFNIRYAARHFARLMRDSGHPIILHLPHVSVEFEPGCTVQEIIDGYKQGMEHKFFIKHSNANEKPAPKPKR